MPESGRTPSVLFVCVQNGGKSQMAAGLMRKIAGDRVDVHSAGTTPGSQINALSAQVLAEVGADMAGEDPPTDRSQLLRTWTWSSPWVGRPSSRCHRIR